MTNLEALEILSIDEDMQKKLPNLKEVYAVAVKAIEKQIPTKPNPYKQYAGKCKCGAVFLDGSTKYCGNCGQALDWSG